MAAANQNQIKIIGRDTNDVANEGSVNEDTGQWAKTLCVHSQWEQCKFRMSLKQSLPGKSSFEKAMERKDMDSLTPTQKNKKQWDAAFWIPSK